MIKFFDMFAGIGGFRAGLTRAGGFECIGHCEINKHADAAYRALHNPKESEVFYEDATKINPTSMPHFDLLCAGFPCQSFSIAGKRKGFSDPRGTMFFEIARVARERKPLYLLLENVPGLLSHDKGRTFAVILNEICELGYSCEWQVLNSKDFSVPQSRRRVYLICYLDRRCAGKVFPFLGTNTQTLVRIVGGSQNKRVYDANGLAKTLTSDSSGHATKTGLYFIDMSAKDPKITIEARCITARYNNGISERSADGSGVLHIKEATKIGYKDAVAGDSVDLSFMGTSTRRGRVGSGIAHTIDTGNTQGVVTKTGRIRRLMPRECFRLQGFTERQIDKLLENTSDTQAYKQAGNAVTVNVVHAIGLRLKTAHRACVHAVCADLREAA